jgi:hypothetical protein
VFREGAKIIVKTQNGADVTECANDINRRGTISEKFLKEINNKRKGCIENRK